MSAAVMRDARLASLLSFTAAALCEAAGLTAPGITRGGAGTGRLLRPPGEREAVMKSRLFLLALLGLAAAASAQTGKTLRVVPKTGPLANRTLYTNSHALLVGVKQYQHLPRDKWLEYADKDASDLAQVLVKS